MNVEITYVTEQDIPEVVDLFEQYRGFYGKAPTPLAETFLRERIASGQSLVLVARDRGRVVGFSQVFRRFDSIELTHDWVLGDLFVDGAARGRRAGGGLVDAVIASAREDGADHIVLVTEHDNAYARRLYENRGFVEEGDDGQVVTFRLPLHGKA